VTDVNSEIAAPSSQACIIIVTFNSRLHFPRQKAALESQTYSDYEIVVWDNASDPGQRPTAVDFPVGTRIIQSEANLGFAAANNRAADDCRGEYLVLLNPDAFPAPDWLERLIGAAKAHPEATMIASLQIKADDPTTLDGAGDFYSPLGAAWRGLEGRPVKSAPGSGDVFGPCAAAALYRKASFLGVGGFDEAYFCYYEDVDLAFRLRLAGGRCFYAADARVAHVGSAITGKQSYFSDYHIARNRLWTFFKNMPLPLLLLLGPGAALLTVWTLIRTLGGDRFRAHAKGTADALIGLPKVLANRRTVQKSRSVSTRAIAGAFTWSVSKLLRRDEDVRPWRGDA
jgi:N-acetylglucosaminyl-diphospho-decaprenol L-rhamnosyltransferase